MSRKKSSRSSSRDRLAEQFLEALQSDFAQHGAEVIANMRKSHPERYAELAGKLILTAEPPAKTGDMSEAKTPDELGRLLIQSVADIDPDTITAGQIKSALAANDRFIADIEKIAGVKKDAGRKDRKGGNGYAVDEVAATLKHLGYD
jgi:hypothetical protein